METETRTTPSSPSKDSGARAATVPPPAPVGAATDLEAELLALAQEEESLQQRKTQKRQTYWEVTIATVTRSIEQLTAHGFDRAAIGKALGFASNGKPTGTPEKAQVLPPTMAGTPCS